MELKKRYIDAGKAFDFGRVSKDYAQYRDIYPKEFYDKIISRNLCIKGQKVLDLGTGTGVLPRNLYCYGAEWTGTDISEHQIEQAERLSREAGMNILYQTAAAEELEFPDNTFDVITACQCFLYFDHKKLMPRLARMLKPDGRLLLLYMAWLPFEDKIAGQSEALVLKYNPHWTGAGQIRCPIIIPDCVYETFELVYQEEYDVNVSFTKETWHGRMRACRGVGASLSQEEIAQWEQEHKRLLDSIAPEKFDVLHYISFIELKPKV